MKKSTKILIIALIAWILIPTGTPDDVLTLGIIKYMGLENYILVILALIALMIYYNITPKKAQSTVKDFGSKVFK